MRVPLPKGNNQAAEVFSGLPQSWTPSQSPSTSTATPTNNAVDRVLEASLATVSSTGVVENLQPFLINPDSLEDNKTSNWNPHSIPGQRDPVMQWASGGIRTLTFDALVTKETSWAHHKQDLPTTLGIAAGNVLGNIAGAFFGVSLPPLADLFSSSTAESGNELSIERELAFYRSLLLPAYSNGKLVRSPPLVILYFSTTFDDSSNISTFPDPGSKITPQTPVWVLLNLKIKVTKFLKNIRPMEAVVSFQFAQYVLVSDAMPALSYTSATNGFIPPVSSVV